MCEAHMNWHTIPWMKLGMKAGLEHWKHFMPYDLQETDKEYTITMPLPGFSVDDIEVGVRGNDIAIDAIFPNKSSSEKSSNNSNTDILPEDHPYNWGRVMWERDIHMQIKVEQEIDPNRVKAKLKQGLLQISFQKRPRQQVNIDEE